MNINTLLNNISEAVAEDIELFAWSKATYGQKHSVYVNYDTRSLPGENNCPYVAIYPRLRTGGVGSSIKKHVFQIVCTVFDRETGIHPGFDNIVEYEGVQRMEAFRKLVETAINGVDIGNLWINSISVDYETIDSFPFMLAGMEIEIFETILISSDPLL